MDRKHTVTAVTLILVAAGVALLAQAPAPSSSSFTEDKLAGFTYRALGPYRAGSWIADIAVPEAPLKSHLYTFYVAVRYGGVWKTTNNGTTFQPVFDGQDVTGIGCLAIAPSNENVVWVGTGDASSVRVTYPGDGVYKSTDAGKSWQRMGLQETRQIGRIVIHPTNPDIVYVAAMGRLWSPSQERGVFKTIDGGKTWTKVLYINDQTGAIDLVINRRQPDTLYAAMYDVQRRPWKLLENGVDQRDPQDHRRREDVDEARRRPAGDAAGPDRPRHLPEEPEHPLRGHRELRQAAADRGRGHARPRAQDRTAAAQHRRRGLPDRRRREDLAEDERGHRRHEREGGVFLQSDPGRSEQRQADHHQQRFAAEFRRWRQDVDRPELELAQPVRQRVRRLPLDVDRPAELRPLDSRERRRCPDLLRRRQDVRPLRQHPGRRVLLDRRRHGGPVSDLRRPPGSRFVARADQRTGGSRGSRGLGDGGRQRRDVQPRGPDRQPVGLQHGPVGRALSVRPEDPHAQVDRADTRRRSAAASVELDAAARALAVQQPDHLHGRAGALPVARPGRPLGGDQPGPDDQRRLEDLAARQHGAVLHHHDDFRVARRAWRDLGRDRRREGAGDAEPRRGVDGRRARRSGRRAGPATTR